MPVKLLKHPSPKKWALRVCPDGTDGDRFQPSSYRGSWTNFERTKQLLCGTPGEQVASRFGASTSCEVGAERAVRGQP